MLKKILKALHLWSAAYTFGLIPAAIFSYLRRSGKVEVRGKIKRLGNQPICLLFNHPSTPETWMSVAMLWPFYLRWPGWVPWVTPTSLYFQAWYWRWILPRMLLVPDHNRRLMPAWAESVKRALIDEDGHCGTVILFPEGGWTCPNKSEQIGDKPHQRLSPLKERVGEFILATGAAVYVVWVDGSGVVVPRQEKGFRIWPDFSRGKIILNIHPEPLKFSAEQSDQEVMETVRQTFVKLAREC